MEWVEALYASAFDEGGIADAISLACGTRSAMVSHVRAGYSLQLMNYWPKQSFERYFLDFRHRDPWGDALGEQATSGLPVAADALLAPDKMMRTAMFNELIKPLGDDTARCLAIGKTGGAGTVIAAVHRAAGDSPFAIAEERRIAQVFPHVLRVLDLHARQARDTQTLSHLSAMVAASEEMMLIVSSDLRVLHMSPAGLRCLEQADGLSEVHGKLRCVHHGVTEALRMGVKEIVRDPAMPPSVLLCPRPSGFAPLRLTLSPAGDSALSNVLICITDPSIPRSDRLDQVAAAFGLTPKEIMLARGLLDGKHLSDVAEERGVSRETLRSQLKSLFLKTGTASQSGLLRLLT